MVEAAAPSRRVLKRLRVYLIRPSRYDDEGFVVQHRKGVIPSNTLFTLNGLCRAADASRELGETKIDSILIDEAVQKVPFRRIAREVERSDTMVAVALCGVQTNQFSRAADLAKRFRAVGVEVLIGGFHVSGVNALVQGTAPEIRELLDLGVHVVRGEVDSRWGEILRQLVEGNLPGMVDMLMERPDLTDMPIPAVDPRHMKRFAMSDMGTIDAGRGCPFTCSFCTIINVQGRRMRCRSPEAILRGIKDQYARGIRHYFFTDDNFARHPQWEGILDGMARLRGEGFNITFMMQVDTLATRIPGFVEKAAAAGCRQVFIGLESISPKNLEAAGKRQNRVEDFRAMNDAWHSRGIIAQCGYILGFPEDTPESIAEDVRRLRDEIDIDQASFFILTPLPGSADHAKALREGVKLDADLNRYDSAHTVVDHPRMTRAELEQAYRDAWKSFFTPEHMKRCLSRLEGGAYWTLFHSYLWYRNSSEMGEHPMMSGFWRMQDRNERRPEFARPGLLPHAWSRMKYAYRQLRVMARLLPELQEVWLASRRADPSEGRLTRILKSALSIQPKTTLLNAAARFNRWRKTRGDLTSYWKALTRFRWWRANPLKTPLNALREWALWTHFMLEVLRSAANDRRLPGSV